MECVSPLPFTIVEKFNLVFTPPSSSSPTLPTLEIGNASSSQVQAPPPSGFTDVQRDLILELRRDNDEHNFRQELMEKKLEWVLESGSEDPQ